MLSSVNYYICFTALLYKLLACLAPRVWNYWQLSGLVDHESLFLFINFIKCIIKRLFIVTDLYAWIFDILTSNLTDLIGKNDCLSLVSFSWQSHNAQGRMIMIYQNLGLTFICSRLRRLFKSLIYTWTLLTFDSNHDRLDEWKRMYIDRSMLFLAH